MPKDRKMLSGRVRLHPDSGLHTGVGLLKKGRHHGDRERKRERRKKRGRGRTDDCTWEIHEMLADNGMEGVEIRTVLHT